MGQEKVLFCCQDSIILQENGPCGYKADTRERNQIVSFALHLSAPAPLALLSIKIVQKFHPKIHYLWHVRGEIPLFLPWWSLQSMPGGTARDPQGNKCLNNTIPGLGIAHCRTACSLLALIFTLREACWPRTFPSSSWGQVRCLKIRHYPGDTKIIHFLSFPVAIISLFYSTCITSFFIIIVLT